MANKSVLDEYVFSAENSGRTYEFKLDEADRAAAVSDGRCSGEEVFARVRKRIRDRNAK